MTNLGEILNLQQRYDFWQGEMMVMKTFQISVLFWWEK